MRPWVRWAASGAYAAAIFAVGGMDMAPRFPGGAPYVDKVMHAGAYFTFAWMIAWAMKGSGVSGGKALVWGAVAASLYGMTDEMHQFFVGGRTASVWDWAADAAGAFLFAGVVGAVRFLWFSPRVRRRGP